MKPAQNYANLRDSAAFNYHRAKYIYGSRLLWHKNGKASRDALVQAFNARTIVLAITAGRSGSDALTHRIGLLSGVTSIHEPLPHYRYILHNSQRDPFLAVRFLSDIKVPALLSYRTQVVAESNHLFGKGFFEACIAMGFRPSLVFQRREARANALSLLRKNSVPGRTRVGRRYVISPSDNPYLPIADAKSLSNFQLCYWYVLEMHLRDDLYRQVCQALGVSFFRLEVEDLNNPEKLKSMARDLNLVKSERELDVFDYGDIGKVVNAVPSPKRVPPKFDMDAEVAECEARLGTPASAEAVFQRIETMKRLAI